MLASDVVQDIRYSVRSLKANRGFAAIAILTFAIGIGATTAIFSVVNATLLRQLPFKDPSRLVSVFLRMPVQYGSGQIDMVWSYPKYRALVASQTVLAETAPHISERFTIGTRDGADVVRGESVGADYFHILGIAPARGRFFSSSEDRATGGDRVVVLSDAFWRARFGGSPSAIGARLEINGDLYTIVGVAPPGFRGMNAASQLWVLYTATRGGQALQYATMHQFEVVARLAPGITPAAARAAIVAAGRTIDASYPNDGGRHWSATSYTLDELRVDPAVGRSVIMLAGAVGILLLIACVNVASLLLARGAARRREVSVRLAMGASRGRVIRQLLTESVVLAGIGVVVGLALAFLAVRTLSALAPLAAATLSSARGNLSAITLRGFQLDTTAVAFSIVVALITAIGAGLAPAAAAARLPLAEVMRQGASTASVFSGLRRLTPRAALVIGEIALAIVLLVGSALMIRSLSELIEAQTGYRPDHVLTARVTLNAERARSEPVGQIWDELLSAVAALPGVTEVASGSCAPVGDHCDGTDVTLMGRPQAHVSFHVVSPNYFKTLGIPVLRGREVQATDDSGAPPVILINETAARTIWAQDDPLTTPLPGNRPTQVIGVVGDVRYEDVESPARAAIFQPVAQNARRTMVLFVRTSGDPVALAGALRRQVKSVDRNHTITDIKTMIERLHEATARNRFATQVLGAFATIALGLAALGIYGVLSLAVTQRRRELSIRMALGASRPRMLRMVLAEASGLVAAGAALGVAGSLVAARALSGVLFGVSPADPAAYLSSATILAAAAALAAVVPALRAMRVQPAAVLRGD